MKKINYLITLLVIVSFITGCSIYPKFTVQKEDIKKIAIISDVCLSYDVKGKVDNVSIAENKKFEESVVNALKEKMEEKGYVIGKTMNSSIGVNFVRDEFNVVENKEDTERNNIKSPPYYVNEIFENEEDTKKIKDFYNSFKNYNKNSASQPNLIHKGAIPLTQKIDSTADILAVVIIRGREVPLGKSLAIAMAVGVLTAGTFAVWPTTYIHEYIFLIKADNGEIIWENDYLSKGGWLTEVYFSGCTKQLIKKLPPKSN